MQYEFIPKQTVHDGRLYKTGDPIEMSEERGAALVKANVLKEATKKETKAKTD